MALRYVLGQKESLGQKIGEPLSLFESGQIQFSKLRGNPGQDEPQPGNCFREIQYLVRQ